MTTQTNSEIQQEFPQVTPDPDIKFALPVVMFTYKHLELFNQHKGRLGRYGIPLALTLLGNMDANTGILHKFKVKQRAEALGCPVQTVYRLIRVLREIGFANMKLRNGTVSGKVLGRLPKGMLQWWEAKREKMDESPCGEDVPFAPHSMPVGMLHPIQITTQIKAKTSEAHWRLSLACSLNIDIQSGKLHTKRAQEWANLAGMDRTWAVKGFTHLNEIGVSQVRIDYDIEGRMPFVSMANGVFQLKKLEAEEGGRRGRGDTQDTHWEQKRLALTEAWGFELTGIAHTELEKLWRSLGTETDKLLAEQRAKFKSDFGKDIPIERSRVFQSAPQGTIPIGNVFAQVQGGVPPS